MLKLLLTNDDGIAAPGINKLEQALKDKFNCELVAPEKEMSASGHAITLHKPLRAEQICLVNNTKGWSVNGTPSDCVKLGVEALLTEPPDLVISGINNGANLGNDVFYSGTVSAALEASFLGYPAVAISLDTECLQPDFQVSADFLVQFLTQHWEVIIAEKMLLNINVPSLSIDDIKGVRLVPLGKRIYKNVFHQRVDPRGKKYFWMAGELAEDEEKETDASAVKKGYIAVTPLKIDLTNYNQMKKLCIDQDF